MEFFFLSGAALSFLLSVLTLSKRNKHGYDYILCVYLFIISIHLLFNFIDLFNIQHNYKYPQFILYSCPIALLHGPMYYIYTRGFFRKRKVFELTDILHFVPFVFMFIMLLVTVYLKPTIEKIEIYTNEIFTSWTSYWVSLFLIITSSLAYTLLSLRLLNKHREHLRTQYSYRKRLELKWLRFFLIGMLCLVLITVAIQVANASIPSFTFKQQTHLVSALLTFFAYYLGYFGIKETNVFTSVDFVESDLNIPNNSSSVNNSTQQYNNLIQVIKDNMLYTDSELTVLKLSHSVNIPVNKLSRLIHKHSGKNFFDFINHFRIEHFKKQSKLNVHAPGFSILSFAYESGFNSKTSFNRAFKKKENITPREFLTIN